MHLRDFSAGDEALPEGIRGSYAAVGHPDSAGSARLAELAEALALGDFLDRPTGKLSAGQKTRVAIAKALDANGATSATAGFPAPEHLRALGMWRFSATWVPDEAFVARVWASLPQAPQSGVPLRDWAQALGLPEPRAQRLAAWLLKTGLIRVA